MAGPLPKNDEQQVLISPLGGQSGRVDPTSVPFGKAQRADGTYHHGRDLHTAPGTVKMIQAAIPGPCYELNGLETGILHIPRLEAPFDWTADWTVEFDTKPMSIGDLDTTDNLTNMILSTSYARGTQVQWDQTYESLELNWIIKQVSGIDRVFLRLVWYTVETIDIPTSISGTQLDLSDWVKISMNWDSVSEDMTVSLRQPQTHAGASTVSTAQHPGKLPWIDFFQLGGVIPSAVPFFGMRNRTHMLVSEFRVYDTRTGGNKSSFERRVPGDTTEPDLVAVWPLNDSETLHISGTAESGQPIQDARLVGNRVHMDDEVTLGASSAAVRFDGSGCLFIPDSHRLREPPNSSMPNFYLERGELTLGFWFRPDPHSPFKLPEGHYGDPDEDRAVLLNWVTPAGKLISRTESFASYHTQNTERPMEHLRVELRKNSVTGFYNLHAFWGELDPCSLNHPAGVPGGQTGQCATPTWPPSPAQDGSAPPAFNIPQGGENATFTVNAFNTNAAAGAQVVALGHETSSPIGLDDPLQYDWLVFVQKKWVGMADAGNRCLLTAYPFNRSTGQWMSSQVIFYDVPQTKGDTGFARDINVYDGTKTYPRYQSAYCTDRVGALGINNRTDVYPLALGAGIPGEFGDEWGNGTAPKGSQIAGLTPTQGSGVGFTISNETRGYAFVGWMADFFAVKRYLSDADRAMIANSGEFAEDMRVQFSRDLLMSYTFEERAGTILREAKGADITQEDQVVVYESTVDPSLFEEYPVTLPFYPRAPAPHHNEAEIYSGEASPVTGIVQRMDSNNNEEIYVTALTGLYEFSRDNHTLTRLLTLPGQGGPQRASIVIDKADVIHIGGGPGRIVIITRDKTVARSGFEAPWYEAPTQLITSASNIGGVMAVTPKFKSDTNPDNLVGWEIPDGQQVIISVGYWSDVLQTRSAPGQAFVCRFTDPAVSPPGQTQAQIKQHHILLQGMPLPQGDNAALITHWEVFRSAANGSDMFLENRIPIGETPGTALVGSRLDVALGPDQADYTRAPAPEGVKKIAMLGERLFGAGLPNAPRSLIWSRLGEATDFPALYQYTMTMTQSPVVGVRARRDRAFAFSRDYMYQILDKLQDVDPANLIVDSVRVTPLTEGAGALNQDAVTDDDDNGLYLFGNKSVYLTEGGIFRSISGENDSSGASGLSWSWPDSWDLSDPDAFVTFHDPARRLIGICGPSSDDPNRRDAMLLFYEGTSRNEMGGIDVRMEMSRIKAMQMSCVTKVLNPSNGKREVWFGTDGGYIYKFGSGSSMGVDYDWLSTVTPKYGFIMSVTSSTQLRLEGSYGSQPSDFMVGAHLRCYREGELLSTRRVTASTVSASWIDVTLDGAHSAAPGDHWTIGAIPFDWESGEMDFDSPIQDLRVMSADIRLGRT